MALRKILTIDQDEASLRRKSRPVAEFGPRLWELLDDLWDTLHMAQGVGLAAPQVGVLRRVVIIEFEDMVYELVNPVIVETQGRQEINEGCLSVPGLCGDTVRPAITRVHAQDRHGNPIEVVGEGILSVALNHEVEHMDGVLYVDKVIGKLQEV